MTSCLQLFLSFDLATYGLQVHGLITLTEMEEVRAKKDWMCPHCIEEKGINPYWICNRQAHSTDGITEPADPVVLHSLNPYKLKMPKLDSSLCLKKRKMAPTGIAIYQGESI